MSQFEPQQIIENDGWTEALFHITPDEFREQVLQTDAVISHSLSQTEDEYVIEHNGQAITISVCETDDVNTIKTDYDLEDFLASNDSELDSPHTFLITESHPKTIEEFFTSENWLDG